GDPATVLLTMRETEGFEEREELLAAEPLFEIGRDFDRSLLFVLPKHDFDGVARSLADLFANRFRNAQEMLRQAVLHNRSCIRRAIKRRLDRYFPFRPEFLFDIVREKHISAAAFPRVYLGCERVFFHLRFRHRFAMNSWMRLRPLSSCSIDVA